MQRLLFIFLLLISRPLPAIDVVIMVDKGAFSNFTQGLKQWKDRIADLVTGEFAGQKKLGAFEVAYIKDHQILSRAELVRDVDKHDGGENRKWHRLTLEASVAVPYLLPLAGVFGAVDVALEANGKVSAKKQYRITMPDVLSLTVNNLADDKIDLRKHVGKIYRLVSLPVTADRLRELLPSGASIETTGERSLLLKVGPRIGAMGVALKANTHVLLHSLFKSQLKVISRVAGHTFVSYRVESLKKSDFALEAKLRTGFTFINTSLLDNVLSSDVITASLARNKQKQLVYEFVYDLSYDKARQALAKAVLGDLSLTQQRATFRNSALPYHGISIIEKRTDLLLELIKSGQISVSAADKVLLPRLRDLLGQEFNGSILDFSRNSETHDLSVSEVNILEERQEVASFKYQYDENNELLLGLLANNVSSIAVDAQALTVDVVSQQQGLRTLTINRLLFDYLYREKRQGQGTVNDFFTVAQNVLGANQATISNLVTSLRANGKCHSKEAEVRISGQLHHRAITNLLTYRPAEVWVGVAKIIGYQPASAFRYPQKRLPIIEQELPRRQRKLLQKFSEQVMPFWQETTATTDKKLVAEKLRDIFKALRGEPFLLELLIFLASADYRQAKDPERFSQGVVVNMALNSPACRVNWSQRGNLQHQML